MSDSAGKQAILDYSRQSKIAPLTPWFDRQLDARIADGTYAGEAGLRATLDGITGKLAAYREQNHLGAVVIGISGGVDSALTAALFKSAGWRVVGHIMPVEQDPVETERGIAACEALGIEQVQIDLTAQYHSLLDGLSAIDPGLQDTDDEDVRIRRGNFRARLRMITLYDQAKRHGGLVASTDNFSELSAGFWTINGDVGDIAPVQSLLKSWEVPRLAHMLDVPESIWRATPTDGLGISAGDEAQLGATYLEWDLMVLAMMAVCGTQEPPAPDALAARLEIGDDARAAAVLASTLSRIRSTWFKRAGTIRFDHTGEDRFAQMDAVDRALAGARDWS